MSEPVITVEGLGKRYTLHHQARSGLLRDQLASLLRNPFRRKKDEGNTQEEFWALRDVNFTVNQGDVLGIIGRNGAGKSTLLKILSRITEPTTGRITIHGRVASLLEVGTGFHGELSGRENIYLNGAILGMTRAEIRKKFDEIVAFSEVEKFLDTPVKHYSSGMYVRLAFAVAAHLEPEILIIDEVLAVGDAAFQKKCLGKMREVSASQGRTVLFVSHNISIIQTICQRCLLLQQGQIIADAPALETAAKYLQPASGNSWSRSAPTTSVCYFKNAGIDTALDKEGNPIVALRTEIFSKTARQLALELLLHDATGQNLAIGQLGSVDRLQLHAGTTTVNFRFSAAHLALGRYQTSLRLLIPGAECFDEVMNALSFEFQFPPPKGLSYRIAQSWGGGSFMLDLQKT